MKTKIIVKTVIAVVLIASALTYLIYQTMQSSWAYYYSVDDFAASKSTIQNHSFRIAGRVKKGTVRQDLEKMHLTFTLTGQTAALAVSYKGAVPDNFAEGVELLVEGRLEPTGIFQADKLITRCESKYRKRLQ